MSSYEIVWLYLGEEYVLRTYDSKAAALAEFRDGWPRVFKLIHGGALRLDEVVTTVAA